jgi:predicted acyl esterase
MARPAFFDYDRSPRHGARCRTVAVPLRNGMHLAADLTLPASGDEPDAGPFPGLVAHYTPYGRAQRRPEAAWWAGRGYAVLVCDIRGTGDSPGMFPGCLSAGENEDNEDVVEWLAAQPFCTGRVVQYGQSYGGMAALRVASLQPPHLVAIVPQEAYSSYYRHTAFPGGIPAGAGRNWADGVPTYTRGKVSAGFQKELWAVHPLIDEFWRQVDIDTKYASIAVPALCCGGWLDVFREGMVENHTGLGERSYLVMGPWPHGALDGMDLEPLPLGAVLAFFDHHCTGDGWDEGAGAPLPAARVMSYELPRPTSRGWAELDGFPPSSACELDLALCSGGRLLAEPGEEATASFVANPSDGPAALVFAPDATFPDDPDVDQHERDALRLGFETGPLEGDVTIVGTARLALRASLSQPDATFVARLMDCSPGGRAQEVTVGYLRASHREGHDHVVAVREGELADYTVSLQPVHWRLCAGHRLRVSLSGGDVPALAPDTPEGTVAVAVGKGGSRLEVPVLLG